MSNHHFLTNRQINATLKIFISIGIGLLLTFLSYLPFTTQATNSTTLPPAIVPTNPTLTPIPNSHTAPLTTAISIIYSEAISPATVSTHTFAVHAMHHGLLTQTYSISGGQISLQPSFPLNPGELVQISATTATLNLSGQGPLTPTVWQFWLRTKAGSAIFQDSEQSLDASFNGGVDLGDLDGDGDLDAFVGNGGGSGTPDSVWLNNSNGIFTNSQTLGFTDTIGVALGDLDGDGDLDAFTANGWANTPYGNQVWLNNGTANFSNSNQNLGNGSSQAVALGDLDGDGDLDAFVVNENLVPNTVWFNDGTATFADSGQSLGVTSSTGVTLGDVDGDGDLDAIVTNKSNVPEEIWLNNGNGFFSDSGQQLGNTTAYKAAVGDIDTDGDLDIFFAGRLTNTLWLNNGSGIFSNTEQTLGTNWTYGADLNDVDGDGDLDIFVGNYQGFANEVWLNDGNGNFSDSGQRLGAGNWSLAVKLGDMDGDGDLDAFIGNTNGADRVWFNLNPPNLGISKNGPATALVGEYITYTLTVSNTGNLTATNLIITDSLPLGATFIQASNGGQLIGNNVVSWTINSLPELTTFNVSFVVTATSNITNNIYSVVADGGYNAVGELAITTIVNTLPILSISKSGPATALTGEYITYTLTTSNSGDLTATNLIISDALPIGATFIEADNGGQLSGSNVISWHINTLAGHNTLNLSFAVTATTNITNNIYTVVADGGYNAVGDIAVTTIVNTPPILSISKSGPATALAGEYITYTLTISNSGDLTATNLIISDTLPTNSYFVQATNGGQLQSGQIISWAIPSLSGKSLLSVSVVITALQNISNTAYAVWANGVSKTVGLNPVVTIIPQPQVTVTKIPPFTLVNPEQILTYTIIITNNGPGLASGVILSDTLALGLDFKQWILQNSGQYLPNKHIRWGPHNLLSGQVYTLQFTTQLTNNPLFFNKPLTNSVLLSAINAPPQTTTTTINITPKPPFYLRKIVSSQIAEPGQLLTYTLLLSATYASQTIKLTDTIATGTTYISGSVNSGVNYKAGQLTYNTHLLAGNIVTISYQVQVQQTVGAGNILSSQAIAHSNNPTYWTEANVAVVIPESSFTQTLVLIYTSGDNNLSDDMIRLLNEAEKGAGNPAIRVLLLLDGPQENDTYLYHLQEDFNPYCPSYLNPTCNGLYTWGETIWLWGGDNVASPSSLSQFLWSSWATYPNATNLNELILILAGHGDGITVSHIDPQPTGYPGQPEAGGFLWDEQPGSTLSIKELGQVLSYFSQQTGQNIGLLYLDACLMSMVEVAYEVQESVDYMLVSESWAWASFPYYQHLEIIDGSKSSKEIGETWLKNEVESLDKVKQPYTFSLLDLSHLITLESAVDDFANSLIPHTNNPSTLNKLKKARLESDCFDNTVDGLIDEQDTYCDLSSFAQAVQSSISDTTIIEAVKNITQAVKSLVITTTYANGTPWIYSQTAWEWQQLGGVSIYLPLADIDCKQIYYNDYYVSFAKATKWDEFLMAYWAGILPSITSSCLKDGLPPGYLPNPPKPVFNIYLPLILKTDYNTD